MPKDGHWLASFEVLSPTPRKKLVFSRKKMTFYMDAHPLLKTKIRAHNIYSSSGVLIGNSVMPISTRANNMRNMRSCSKKWRISGHNCVFLFFRRKFCHNFVTPFWSLDFRDSTKSNTTRAARAAQGCTDDSVRMGAGDKTHE